MWRDWPGASVRTVPNAKHANSAAVCAGREAATDTERWLASEAEKLSAEILRDAA